jgi:hypothetical protein
MSSYGCATSCLSEIIKIKGKVVNNNESINQIIIYFWEHNKLKIKFKPFFQMIFIRNIDLQIRTYMNKEQHQF